MLIWPIQYDVKDLEFLQENTLQHGILVEIFTYESRSMDSHSLTMDNGLSNRLTYFRY